jgi:Fe-S-cluster containining protein
MNKIDTDLMEFFKKNGAALVETSAVIMKKVLPLFYEKGLHHTVASIYNSLDQINEIVDKKAKTSCGVGCSACCHTDINLTRIELDHIKLYMEQLDIVPTDNLLTQQTTTDFNSLKWAQKACSLLDEDGNCSVYNARPFICRAWNSVSPAEYCGDNEHTTSVARTIEGYALILVIKELNDMIYPEDKETGLFLHEELCS